MNPISTGQSLTSEANRLSFNQRIFHLFRNEKTIPMFTTGLYNEPLEQNTYSIEEIRVENREKLLIHVRGNDSQRLW
jgi:hypothetical protein